VKVNGSESREKEAASKWCQILGLGFYKLVNHEIIVLKVSFLATLSPMFIFSSTSWANVHTRNTHTIISYSEESKWN